MIKLIELLNEICDFNISGVYFTKIRSSVISYGTNYSFLMTWKQTVDNTVTAFIQKQDNNIVVTANAAADFDEIAEFINVIGAQTVFTDKETAKKLNLNYINGGIVMQFKTFTADKNIVNNRFIRQYNPDYKALYALLVSCDLKLPDYEPFLMDLSYRIRHNTARIFANHEYTAAALCAFEDKSSAIISAVATDIKFRNQGLGSGALNALTNSLLNENKQVYLYRDYNKNEQFYRFNRFIDCDEFVIGKP